MTLASIRRMLRSRHVAWLLALALWLPGAQWLAATHALLHLHASVAGDIERPAHLPDSCETCVVAAAIGGAAPPAQLAPGMANPVAQSAPLERLAPGPTATHAAPYRSRAPPLPHA